MARACRRRRASVKPMECSGVWEVFFRAVIVTMHQPFRRLRRSNNIIPMTRILQSLSSDVGEEIHEPPAAIATSASILPPTPTPPQKTISQLASQLPIACTWLFVSTWSKVGGADRRGTDVKSGLFCHDTAGCLRAATTPNATLWILGDSETNMFHVVLVVAVVVCFCAFGVALWRSLVLVTS